jgi:hypothetical protein
MTTTTSTALAMFHNLRAYGQHKRAAWHVHLRINRRAAARDRAKFYRKMCDDYQWSLCSDASALRGHQRNGNRIFSWKTREFGERFAHLICRENTSTNMNS